MCCEPSCVWEGRISSLLALDPSTSPRIHLLALCSSTTFPQHERAGEKLPAKYQGKLFWVDYSKKCGFWFDQVCMRRRAKAVSHTPVHAHKSVCLDPPNGVNSIHRSTLPPNVYCPSSTTPTPCTGAGRPARLLVPARLHDHGGRAGRRRHRRQDGRRRLPLRGGLRGCVCFAMLNFAVLCGVYAWAVPCRSLNSHAALGGC